MGFHEKLAVRARAMGKTAADFHKAAQQHANATWVMAIAAGAVWYFADWKWAMIPAVVGAYVAIKSISSTMVAARLETSGSEPTSATADKYSSIIQAYGSVLETDAPTPGTVADASKLPYPKEETKRALIAALQSNPGYQMKEHLKIAFIRLADWQDGVGETNRGFDASSVDLSRDVNKLAEQVLSASGDGKSWVSKATEEQKALKKELESLGLW